MHNKYLIFLPTVFLVILVDQLTKFYVMRGMQLHESFTVVPGLINLTYVRNPGAAFGFLAYAPSMLRISFFIAITVLAVGLIIYYVVKSKKEEQLLILALALILGGALGNLIDRMCFGEVVDFIDVFISIHHWPAFNIADSAISLGAFFMLLEMFKRGKEDEAGG